MEQNLLSGFTERVLGAVPDRKSSLSDNSGTRDECRAVGEGTAGLGK